MVRWIFLILFVTGGVHAASPPMGELVQQAQVLELQRELGQLEIQTDKFFSGSYVEVIDLAALQTLDNSLLVFLEKLDALGIQLEKTGVRDDLWVQFNGMQKRARFAEHSLRWNMTNEMFEGDKVFTQLANLSWQELKHTATARVDEVLLRFLEKNPSPRQIIARLLHTQSREWGYSERKMIDVLSRQITTELDLELFLSKALESGDAALDQSLPRRKAREIVLAGYLGRLPQDFGVSWVAAAESLRLYRAHLLTARQYGVIFSMMIGRMADPIISKQGARADFLKLFPLPADLDENFYEAIRIPLIEHATTLLSTEHKFEEIAPVLSGLLRTQSDLVRRDSRTLGLFEKAAKRHAGGSIVELIHRMHALNLLSEPFCASLLRGLFAP